MKLTASQLPDVTDFNYHECVFGGDDCIWFFPHLEGVKWTPQNIIFRSSIWRKSDWTLISAGLKKFFNWSQEPLLYPPPDAMTQKINCVEKLDGSCLIVSKYNGELIIRTRRALAETMLNGDEIKLFQRKYPKVFNNSSLDNNYSLIFEWITPSNQIVCRYGESDIRLIGEIDHRQYLYTPQNVLDVLAEKMGVKRPRYFTYKDIGDMLQKVTDLKGEEGICVYYGGDQHIRKIKSDWYVSVHNFRNAMSLKNIIELYFISGAPNYADFSTAVLNQFTYEGLAMAQPLISSVCDGMKHVKRIIEGMHKFVDTMKLNKKVFPTRKQMAEHILASYGQTNRADIVFTILDGKDISINQNKKLLFQILAE